MPVYLFYDKSNGKILHIHREIFMDSGKTVELDKEQLIDQLKDLLPAEKDVGILILDKDPERQRGYRFYVDIGTKRVIKVAKPPRGKEGPK